MDPGPARTARPLPRLGLARRVAPRARRAVHLAGYRSPGTGLGSGVGVPGGSTPRKWPYVDVQLGRGRSAPTLSLFLYLLLLFLFLFVLLFWAFRTITTTTFLENVSPAL